jgi:hypothetical protein
MFNGDTVGRNDTLLIYAPTYSLLTPHNAYIIPIIIIKPSIPTIQLSSPTNSPHVCPLWCTPPHSAALPHDLVSVCRRTRDVTRAL